VPQVQFWSQGDKAGTIEGHWPKGSMRRQKPYNDLMGENQFFLSYSRKQLYFAEALSLALQKAGLDVWMDLQQLEPGSDWHDQIDEGLRKCTGLILVASKQSLASPYVEGEWRAVMDSGKPVYIAYYEEVNLPAALQSSSLVDFRGSFKKAVGALATALKTMSSIRERVQPPNRLGLPQKMPLMVMLVAGLLVIEALFPTLRFLFTGSAIRTPFAWGQGFSAVISLWFVWQLLHHKYVVGVGRLALLLLVPNFFLLQSGRLGTESGIGLLISCSLQVLFVIIAIYLLEKGSVGAELLRWSTLGADEDAKVLRRRINKRESVKDKQVQVALHQVLTARNSEQKGITSVEPPGDAPTTTPVPIGEGMHTYSLHYVSADNPVAISLRHALNGESLQEVDSNAQTHIVILTENLPRSKLQELLDLGGHVVLLLSSNIAFVGDALLERAASSQLIDYRDRSRSMLTALARTLKELPEGNLPIGPETDPRPLNSTVLPPSVYGMGWVVFNMGAWLVLSGSVSLAQSFLDAVPLSLLNLAGFVCGLIWIKLAKALWQRETTNSRFVPSLLISTCLAVPLYLGSVFVIAEVLKTNALFDWTITLRSLFTHPTYWLCLIFPGGIVVVWIATVWRRRLRDWLPAFISRPELGDRFKPLFNDIYVKRLVWVAWALGAFITFGLPAALYTVFHIHDH
jgi:hypothetical protein